MNMFSYLLDRPCEPYIPTLQSRVCHYFSRFMRPNTPHWVLTVEPAVCRGGHFYCASTLRDTSYGYFHAFIGHTYLTNTEHKCALTNIRRMIFDFNFKFQHCYLEKGRCHSIGFLIQL